jgi:type IV secretion system protein VirB10
MTENKLSQTFVLSFILCFLLTACKEEQKKDTAAQKPVQQIADSVHILKEAPPKINEQQPAQEPEPEALIVPEVKFPSAVPLLREEKARHLRGERHHLFRQHHAERPEATLPEEWHLEDPDYQQWEPVYSEDKSTYPVDRSRILTADMRIPAILEDSVNSQVPGRLIAVVDRDIYSPNGKKILIPAYSKIICHHSSLADDNSTRLPAQCQRLILPSGVSVQLTEAQASDQVGRNGLIGNIDYRTLARYGAAFTISLISALAQASSSLSNQPAYNNATSQLSNNFGQVTAKVLEQRLNLTPILTIPGGTRIQIIPGTDIVFRAPMKVQKEMKQ